MSESRIHRTTPSAKVVLRNGQRNGVQKEITAGMYVEGQGLCARYNDRMIRNRNKDNQDPDFCQYTVET